jgi:SAM-dependent methyltransferase
MPDQLLERLATASTGLHDPFYLVHRSLMAALQHASQYARGRLLDIGCGNKPYEPIFAPRITAYVGCDVEQSSLRKVDILCSAHRIPVPDASFDTVLSTQTIEHVPEPAAVLPLVGPDVLATARGAA